MIAVAELALMGAEQRGDVTAHGTTLTDSATGAIDRTYDVLDRVTQEVTPQGIVNFTYDALSRRLTMRANAQQPVTYAYEGKKRGRATFLRIFVVVRAGAGSIPGPRRWRLPLASLRSRRVAGGSHRCGAR
jgi:YD repeat-containing protein